MNNFNELTESELLSINGGTGVFPTVGEYVGHALWHMLAMDQCQLADYVRWYNDHNG